jgi:predicted phosphodiesterase
LHEGCTGFYPAQEFLVDLDRRAQNKVVRRLFVDLIRQASPHFRNIKLVGIGGNHGEFRKKGNAFTNTGDNDDVSVLESVQEIFADRADYSHVSFEIPLNELDIVVDVAGVNIGLAHGHQFKGGASIAAKAETWWKNQDFGLQAQRESQILVTGHFHHFLANTWGTRTHFQAPSQDPGSAHYTNYSGL